MKDMLGRKIEVSQYIAYALRHGDSPSLGIYHVREVKEGSIKAHKINESYGDASRYSLMWPLDSGVQVRQKYIVWDRGSSDRKPGYREMTEEEQIKTDNKVSTLNMPERTLILDGLTRDVMDNYFLFDD